MNSDSPDGIKPASELRFNLGTRTVKPLKTANFPDAGAVVRHLVQSRPPGAVDVLLVNPPSPDGGIWIRTQHRVGRRSREEMIWPQCSLAQLAALLHPDYKVEVIDAIAERMSWQEFEKLLREKSPKYYLTQVTAPTLTNDMYGVMLARSMGARTMAFGTHVTPMPNETMRDYPALDFVLRGEPELTLRELIDALENRAVACPAVLTELFRKTDPSWQPALSTEGGPDLSRIKGLIWRQEGEIKRNVDRPFVPNLDDLPVPLYHLLPLSKYRMPLMKGPFSFVVTSRGCPAGCKYCIKHVSYQNSVRLLSPERIMEEISQLHSFGIRNIHMYADLFTVNREQVMGLCELILKEGLKIRWTCNSRVDFVDEEMLKMMGRSGCWMISWGIESGNEQILRRAAKGANPKKAHQALSWARAAGIKNWGYFIIGLPGETVETIRETIDLAKTLPLELALFHIAAPYPGTPFFFEVVENGWFREGTQWEQVDMDKGTVLQYENLSAEDLIHWQRRAFREWAFRPGPAFVYLKMLFSDLRTFKRAVRVGMEHLGWALGRGHGASKDSRVHGLRGSEVQRFGVASKTLNP
ncbi:MAG: radical SAM protein [Acidobacteria bacterium]|nr:MAG: radical SAM protein [Acidobacteriota bacterium]